MKDPNTCQFCGEARPRLQQCYADSRADGKPIMACGPCHWETCPEMGNCAPPSNNSRVGINTVSVPYIPDFDKDVMPPSYFEEKVKEFGDGYPSIQDFELQEIQGTRLVLLDGKWMDHGHQAIYRRVK